MNFARVLLDLWRLRAVVAVAVVGALLVTLLVAYRVSFPAKLESRRYDVGVATTRILVDTPDSQVVAVSPDGSDTLGVRANLMANLMVDGEIKHLIAERAGVPADRLVGLAKNEQPIGPPERAANVLTTSVVQDDSGNELPIIQVETEAAEPRMAARLANAAVEGLRDYLATKAAAEQVPDASRLRVHGFGSAQAGKVTRGPSLVIACVAGLFVFIAGCATILGIASLVRMLRTPEPPQEAPLKLVDDVAGAEVATSEKASAISPPPTSAPRLRWDAGAPVRAEARQGK